MFHRTRFLLAFIASLAAAVPAFAAESGRADDLRAQLSLGLDFGSTAPVRAAYALTLGYRAEAESPIANVLRLDVSDAGAIARLAGLPLLERNFQVNAIEGDNWRQDEKPWYARSWVYWTLGGLAATAALGGAGGGTDYNHDHGTDVGPTGTGNVCAGDSCAQATGCTPTAPGTSGACVNCNDSVITNGCDGSGWAARPVAVPAWSETRDIEAPWLGEGTGGMGDLVAR